MILTQISEYMKGSEGAVSHRTVRGADRSRVPNAPIATQSLNRIAQGQSRDMFGLVPLVGAGMAITPANRRLDQYHAGLEYVVGQLARNSLISILTAPSTSGGGSIALYKMS